MNEIISDTLTRWKGARMKKISDTYAYAFLVHARDHRDMYRKYPFLKRIPISVLLFITKHLRPITVSRITGLKNVDTNLDVPGYVIGIPMTAGQMIRNRKTALKRIRQAVQLARGNGASMVGLGGLTASLSAGGGELLDLPVNITTGHAYTAYNIVKNLDILSEKFGVSRNDTCVAVVGAAGSVGSMSAIRTLGLGFSFIILIDLLRKNDQLETLKQSLLEKNPRARIIISHDVKDIEGSDFIITATNTPEALVTVDHVRPGQVIIDDAQPSDIHPDVLKLPDVLVIEAGVVHTPGISSNFNYGLKARTDNFCCMAELLILASRHWKDNYVIHRTTEAHVEEISKWGETLGFHPASFQNFLESISPDKIDYVRSLMRTKHGLPS